MPDWHEDPVGKQTTHWPKLHILVQHGGSPSPQVPPVAMQVTHWPFWQTPVQQSWLA
jgi:hypothetical protein